MTTEPKDAPRVSVEAPPADAPPSYEQVTGSSTTSRPARDTTHLDIPQSKNGIPADRRRSMEDEHRPLPEGWVRQYDTKEQHQFFVNTSADPPRSIWHHPYDDEQYLATLSSEEREKIQEEEDKLRRPLTPADDKKSPLKDEHHESFPSNLPARPDLADRRPSDANRKKGFGEKLKDKVTGMTREEREQQRIRQAQADREAYEMHVKFRNALQKAQITGQPQFLAKDRDGRDIYVEPPYGPGSRFGPGYGGGYGGGGYGYNPYSQGPYANPNARFVRPPAPYGRPYGGGGYGGGIGLPIAGGLLGGALLGGLLF